MPKTQNWCPNNAFKNIDQANGLCNDTRLQVNELGKNVIGDTIITCKNIGHKTFIPRRTLLLHIQDCLSILKEDNSQHLCALQ